MSKSRFFIVMVASVVLSSAAAADGYDYEPVGKGFAPPPVFSWTGFYVGGHVGYSWQDVSGALEEDLDRINLSALDLDKSFGGGQIGYNYQTGQFVFGIEGDYSWLNNSDSATFPIIQPPRVDVTVRAEIEYLASIRARLGWAWQNVLAYGTVGWGWADYDFTVSQPFGVTPSFEKISFKENGVVYGGGLQVGLTKSVSVGAEYLHYDVGARRALTNPPIPTARADSFVKFDDIDVVRGTLNFNLY